MAVQKLGVTFLPPIPVIPSLSALTLSESEVTVDEAVTINIIGATSGSIISADQLPAGLTLDSGARTISGTPTEISQTAIALTETLEGSPNSPRVSNVSIDVVEDVPVSPITEILADGWQATYPTPPASFDPDNDPVTFTVARAGFDSAGDATTHDDTIIVTTRVREPYPNQETLTDDTVAISDYVYADDAIAGVTNNSTEASPKAVAAWLTRNRSVIGNAIGGNVEPVEIAAFHHSARDGKQVACVVFSVSDGTTTLTATVTDTVVSGRSGDQNAVLVYRMPEVDITSLNTGMITVNAKVYPHVGVAASVLDSADKTDSALFSPRYFLKNTTLLASPPLAYVATTGNDGTGVVSTNAGTAEASPFATIAGAIIAINAAYSATTGIDGAEIRLGSGSFAMGSVPSGFAVQRVAALTITRAPGVAREDAVATIAASNIRMRFYGSFASPITTGAIRFKDVSVSRTGAGCLQGETAGYLDIFHEDVAYDGGSVPNISLFRGNCWWLGCDTINLTSQAMGAANTGTHSLFRGIDFQDEGLSLQGQCIVGCMTWAGSIASNATLAANGAVLAFNKFMAINGAFIEWNGTTDTTEGAAIVQNVFEYVGTGQTQMIGINRDNAGNDFLNLIEHCNTFVGYHNGGRHNQHYDEGATPRVSKLTSMKNNIVVSMNCKGDIFVEDGARQGNWPIRFGVGHANNIYQYQAADDTVPGLGALFSQDFGGIGLQQGLTGDPLAMNWTDYQATTAGPVAGAGWGDYTTASDSVARNAANRLLSHDLAGDIRASGVMADSVGAYAGGPNLRSQGQTGLIGTATPATYNPATGEGTVYRAASSGNQSYVSWTELDPAKTYEIQISASGPSGVSIRSGGALGTIVATVFSGTTATHTFQPDANGDATISISANDTSASFTVQYLREVG